MTQGEYVIVDETARIPVASALALLRTTYWASELPIDRLTQAMQHSLCFGVEKKGELVAFARVVTDRATFAYLTDVVVAESERGRGVGRWLMEQVLAHPDLQGLRRFALLTSDAMELYEKLGFERGAGALTYMERRG